MSENQNQNNKPASATQRLGQLENAVMSLYNLFDGLTRDLTTMKEALKLLDNKVSSIVKAASSGEAITDEVLDRIMVENNVQALAKKVSDMVAGGVVELEAQVSENSFVVGSELDDDGKVVNPRLQFALKAISAELQAKILGSKSGDILQLEERKLKFKVLESYKIRETQPAPAPTEELNASNTADAAPQAQAEPTQESAPVDQSVTPAVNQ